METNYILKQKNSLAIASVVVLVIFIILVAGAYFWVSKKSKGQAVFPAGLNYMGPQGQNLVPVPTVDLSQVGKSGSWIQATGQVYKFKFIYPAELQVTAFINDPTDKMAWVTGIVPPQQNIVVNVESLTGVDEKYIERIEDYVKNYWKKFSGLSGTKSVEPFKSQKGLEGYKVVYLDKSGNVANTNYFFAFPNDQTHLLHLINGMLPDNIFGQIVNGVEFLP